MFLNKVKSLLFSLLITYSACLIAEPLDTNLLMSKVYKAYDLQNIKPDSAIKLANEVLSTSIEHNYQAGIASAYIRLGSIYNLRGKNDSALFYTKEALRIRKSLKDIDGAIGVSYILSYIYEETGHLDSAYSILFEAINLNKIQKDTINEIDLLLELGNLYISYENFEEGNGAFKLALELSKGFGYEHGEILSYSGLGRLAYIGDEYDLALDFFNRANFYYSKTEDPLALALNIQNIALCYVSKNEFKKASAYYKEVIKIYNELKYRQEESLGLFNLGTLYLKSNEIDSAIASFNKAKLIAFINGDIHREAKCDEFLSEAFKIKGDYTSAYNSQAKYLILKDSILNLEKIQSISEMQTKYETDKKVQAIQLLKLENKAKEGQRNLLFSIALGLLVLVLALSIYFIQRNRINKRNEQIAKQKLESVMDEQEIKTYNAILEGQEEERMRIASDLHDRLGSMLSTIKLMFSSIEDKIDNAQTDNKKQLTKTTSLIDDACVEVRRISHNLGTGMVANFGLKRSLEELFESIQATGKIECQYSTFNFEKNLPLKVEVEIYRIAQETVNNILKHANASQITAQLNRLEGEISLSIEDNGVGFDPNKIKSAGMGLANLKRRANKVDGEIHIDSAPGRGTTVILEIPISNEAEIS